MDVDLGDWTEHFMAELVEECLSGAPRDESMQGGERPEVIMRKVYENALNAPPIDRERYVG